MIAWGGATAPPLFARGSRGLLCGMCGLEGKEGGRSQDKGGSQKAEAYRRGEEEKTVGVPLTTPEQGASGRCCFIGGYWEIPDHGI